MVELLVFVISSSCSHIASVLMAVVSLLKAVFDGCRISLQNPMAVFFLSWILVFVGLYIVNCDSLRCDSFGLVDVHVNVGLLCSMMLMELGAWRVGCISSPLGLMNVMPVCLSPAVQSLLGRMSTIPSHGRLA